MALVGDHQRDGTGGRRQVDVLGWLAQRGELGHDIDRHQPRPLERLKKTIAAVHQLLDLLARQFASTGQLAEHTLAIGTSFVDHLTTLLLGHDELGLGIGRCILAASGCFDLGLFAQPLRFVGGFAQHSRGAVLGADLDLRGRLARRLQNSRSLFAEHSGDDFFVERHDRTGAALGGTQLALEELLTLLQSCHLGGNHPEQIAHLCLVVAAT